MFEAAYEIRCYARYMVASQEEVPDLSFPYDKLVCLFRTYGADTRCLLKKGVSAYVSTYEDYIYGVVTGMPAVTLAALDLCYCDPLRKALCELVCALLKARDERGLPSVLLQARQNSRSFVAGLYVDLADFCWNLRTILGVVETPSDNLEMQANIQSAPCPNAKGYDWMNLIADACKAVLDALSDSGLILANSSIDTSCNGVSLYLPYLSDEENDIVDTPLVKGGPVTGGSKGMNDVLNYTASNLLLCARRDLIGETEGYYADLQLAEDTDWYRFIAEVWSRILITYAPNDLDIVYSAQQSAINAGSLLNSLKNCVADPCSCKDKKPAPCPWEDNEAKKNAKVRRREPKKGPGGRRKKK
jgi:Clostripain family